MNQQFTLELKPSNKTGPIEDSIALNNDELSNSPRVFPYLDAENEDFSLTNIVMVIYETDKVLFQCRVVSKFSKATVNHPYVHIRGFDELGLIVMDYNTGPISLDCNSDYIRIVDKTFPGVYERLKKNQAEVTRWNYPNC